MKYQCQKCKELFTHPSKQTVTAPFEFSINVNDNKDSTEAATYGLQQALQATETHICPFCGDKHFSEFVEPQEDITSVKSVPLEECDKWIAEGYKVRELYAKTATLVKMEVH